MNSDCNKRRTQERINSIFIQLQNLVMRNLPAGFLQVVSTK